MEYLETIEAAGFREVSIIDEIVFPVDMMLNDPAAQAIIKLLKISPEVINDFAGSVLSAKVSAVRPG